jgi:hypothetical protein
MSFALISVSFFCAFRECPLPGNADPNISVGDRAHARRLGVSVNGGTTLDTLTRNAPPSMAQVRSAEF